MVIIKKIVKYDITIVGGSLIIIWCEIMILQPRMYLNELCLYNNFRRLVIAIAYFVTRL